MMISILKWHLSPVMEAKLQLNDGYRKFHKFAYMRIMFRMKKRIE